MGTSKLIRKVSTQPKYNICLFRTIQILLSSKSGFGRYNFYFRYQERKKISHLTLNKVEIIYYLPQLSLHWLNKCIPVVPKCRVNIEEINSSAYFITITLFNHNNVSAKLIFLKINNNLEHILIRSRNYLLH